MAGIVILAIDAGAELGLPSSASLPALALALENGSGGCNVEHVSGMSGAPKGKERKKKKKNYQQLEPDAVA